MKKVKYNKVGKQRPVKYCPRCGRFIEVDKKGRFKSHLRNFTTNKWCVRKYGTGLYLPS